MRIFIDIGHPAHVHYFRNFIKIMEGEGHKFFVCARNKEVTHSLLNHYQIDYTSRGKGRKGLIGKAVYTIEADLKLLGLARKFKPDLFLSFGSAYAAHASRLLRRPHIAFDDTEHARFEHLMYVPFTDVILTPNCFNKNLGKRQIRFESYMELCYLHPKYFTPNPSILNLLGVNKNEKYIIMRFVSWNAAHDIGQSGLSMEMKCEAVKELSKYARVFISSERELPESLKQYQIQVPPARMHDVLYYAYLYFGDGGTMTSESAILGTPAILVSSSTTGYLTEEEEKYDLIYRFTGKDDSQQKALDKALSLIKKDNLKQIWETKRMKLLQDKIDVTAYMVNFIQDFYKNYCRKP
jgi:predicted glycosyltransferase